jgi:multiple sugar transport system substrate-binding protein
MFRQIKNPLYRRINRREFLEQGGATIAGMGVGAVAIGLGSSIVSTPVQAASSEEAKWKQFSGSKLTFISENTPPTFALKEHLKPFYDLTGIEVEILTDGLMVVHQKLGVDFRSRSGTYQMGYVQDKPIGCPFADFFTDLNKMFHDDTLPTNSDGYEDSVWFDNYVDISCRYYDKTRMIGLPYDSAVACTFYRQDLFEKYTKDFEKEFGYRMEFTNDTTYQHLRDFAAFFKTLHAKDQQVPYGYAQHQGNIPWTTQLDIQRMMFANGRWLDFNIDDKIGSKNPGPTNWGDEQSVLIFKKYIEQAEVSHPDNLALNTLDLNTAYQAGKIAIQIQYNEFAASVEDPKTSVAAGGKTGYAVCPKGDASWILPGTKKFPNGGMAVNGCNGGIAAIGINDSIPEKMKKAAYLFVMWSTSHKTQLSQLQMSGGTPDRKSVLADPDVAKARQRPTTMPNALTFDAVYDHGIKDPHFVLGPKFPKVNEFYQILTSQIQACVAGKIDAHAACQTIKKQVDELNGV